MPQRACNILYLTILPIIRLGSSSLGISSVGRAEEIITLMGDEALATEFFPDEVERYEQIFKGRLEDLMGGHVVGWDFEHIKRESGRVIVKVLQYVE